MKTSALSVVLAAASTLACARPPLADEAASVQSAHAHDVDNASEAPVDRFSGTAGHLMVRDAANGLPAANAPIDFDTGPFITAGLGPQGEHVRYYNFDVQSTTPAPIFVFFREGDETPVEGQLNVVDAIPGDAGYSDFWRVHKVTVPGDYVANSIASLGELTAAGFAVEALDVLVNCPIVPAGSKARLRGGSESAELHAGWYRGDRVHYFSFEERALAVVDDEVPVSPIFVTFNENPSDAGGGPASGFVTEVGSLQTHNVVASLPSDANYSPLWLVDVYDNAAFSTVTNLATAANATTLASGVATVNCPIVSIE